MDTIQATRYAHSLYRVHGPKAEAEAARRLRDCEARGREDEAKDWRAIRAAIHHARGPHQT